MATVSPEPPDFWASLYDLHQRAILCDLHFYVNSSQPDVDYEVIPAHKVVLAASSSYFHAASTAEDSIQDFYHLDGIKQAPLKLLIDYVYRQVSWQDIQANQEALTAAEALGIYQHETREDRKEVKVSNSRSKVGPRVVFVEVDSAGKRHVVKEAELSAKQKLPKPTPSMVPVNPHTNQKTKKAYSLLTGLEHQVGFTQKPPGKSIAASGGECVENDKHDSEDYCDTVKDFSLVKEGKLDPPKVQKTTNTGSLIEHSTVPTSEDCSHTESILDSDEAPPKTAKFDQGVIVEFNESDQFQLPMSESLCSNNQGNTPAVHEPEVDITLPGADIKSPAEQSHSFVKVPQQSSTNVTVPMEIQLSNPEPQEYTVQIGYSGSSSTDGDNESRNQGSGVRMDVSKQLPLKDSVPVMIKDNTPPCIRRSSRTPKPSRLLREMDSTFRLQRLMDCETVNTSDGLKLITSTVISESQNIHEDLVLNECSVENMTEYHSDISIGAKAKMAESQFCDTQNSNAGFDTNIASSQSASCDANIDEGQLIKDHDNTIVDKEGRILIDSHPDHLVDVLSPTQQDTLLLNTGTESDGITRERSSVHDHVDLSEVKIEIFELNENQSTCSLPHIDDKKNSTTSENESFAAEDDVMIKKEKFTDDGSIDSCDEPVEGMDNKLPHEGEQYVPRDKKYEKSKLYQCRVCHRYFRGLTGIIHHERKVHSIRREFPCPACTERCGSHRELELHLSKVHQHVSFHCEVCGAKFRSKLGYKIHVEKQHGNAPPSHVCDVCGKTFHLRQDLRSHQLYRHSDARPFHCSLCPRAFKAKNMLLRHSNTVHSSERKFQCDVCGIMFKTRNDAKRHRERHFTEKSAVRPRIPKEESQESYPCSYCTKVFKKRRLQLNHEKLQHHEKSAGLSFTCTLCDRSFPIKHYLMQHIKNCHTPARYHCQECQAEFIQSSDLRRHRETPGRCKGGISQPKPYHCKHCSRGFSLKSNLMKHLHQPGRCKGPKQMGSEVFVVVKPTEENQEAAEEKNDIPEGSLQILEVDNDTNETKETYILDLSQQSTLQLQQVVESSQSSEVMELNLGGQEMQEVQIEVIPDMTLATFEGQTLRLMSDIAGLNTGHVTIAGQTLQASYISGTDSTSGELQTPGNQVTMVANVLEKSCDQVALVTNIPDKSDNQIVMVTDVNGKLNDQLAMVTDSGDHNSGTPCEPV